MHCSPLGWSQEFWSGLPFELFMTKECCWLVLKLILCPETLLWLLYSSLFYFSHSPKISSVNNGSFNSHLPHYITLHGNFSFLITLARTFNIVLSISIKMSILIFTRIEYIISSLIWCLGDFLMVFLSFIDSDDLLTFSLNLLIILNIYF